MPSAVLRVLPDSDRVEQALEAASRSAGVVDASGVCTLGQLVRWCEPWRFAGRAPAPRLLHRLLVRRFAPALASAAFGEAAKTPEFATAVAELLGQLKAQGVAPAALAEAAGRAGGTLEARARAVAALFEQVDQELERQGLIDQADALAVATRRVREQGLPPRLARLAELRVEHVHDYFPARLDFLEALAVACHRAGVRFVLTYPNVGCAEADLFVAPALRFIEARWQSLSVDLLSEVPATPLAGVAAEAFGPEPKRAPAPALRVFTAATPREELRVIARRVKQLVAAGTPPERIAVAFRDLAADTEALVECFEELALPVRVRLGVPLGGSTVGRLALSLFDLAERDFPAEGVVALLESRYARALSVDCPEPWRWIGEAGIRDDAMGGPKGQGAWAARLAALEARLTSPAAKQEVRALAERVHQLLTLVRAIPARGSAEAMLGAWWRALGSSGLGVLEALRQREPREGDGLLTREVDRALARDQAAAEALGALVESMREALRASGLADRELERAELARWLRSAAAEVNLAARGPRSGAVWLLDARELAGRTFEHVFVGGLLDGRFPGRPPPPPLFSDDERVRLNVAAEAQLFRVTAREGGLELPLRLAEDRLLLHLCLAAGERSVTVSRARSDEAGRELLGSPFLDALARAVEGLVVEAVPRAAVPPLDEVASEAELRARAALEVLSEPATRQGARDPRREALARAVRGEAWFADAQQHAVAESERLRFFTNPLREPGRYSGAVREPELLAALGPILDYPKEKPASAAELSAWGNCGFAGLARQVLRLRSPQVHGEELDARGRGSLWHEVLQRLVPALRDAGLLAEPSRDLAAVDRLIELAVQGAAAELGGKVATGHPVVWRLGQARAGVIARRLVLSKVAAPGPDVQPESAEQGFGRASDPAPWAEVVLPAAFEGERPVYVTGKIDRLDAGPSRSVVIDYKAGSAGAAAGRRESLLVADFQLPLYLLAVRQAWPDRSVEALWVGIRGRDRRVLSELLALEGLLATDAERRLALQGSPPVNLANAVHGLLGRLRGGDFGARPHDCTFCELRAVCRISARQLQEDA